jgi:hypothetical protein
VEVVIHVKVVEVQQDCLKGKITLEAFPTGRALWNAVVVSKECCKDFLGHLLEKICLEGLEVWVAEERVLMHDCALLMQQWLTRYITVVFPHSLFSPESTA